MVRQAHHHPEPGRRANHNDQNSKSQTIGVRSYLMDSYKVLISFSVHCNTLKLQALKFAFCAFCGFILFVFWILNIGIYLAQF
jgi:hypothetical protein